ncbi:MAG: N-acetyltransferase [Anaerolineae bacterium]
MMIRKARVADTERIGELVNHYAAQGQMLPRSRGQIYQSIRDFVVVEDEEGQVVGCGALAVLWEDLAEIRSLAIAEGQQGNGLGSLIVSRLLEEARELGVERVFALTYQVAFFQRLGFHIIPKETLPQKIWADCIACLKFPNCDETAVLLHLEE